MPKFSGTHYFNARIFLGEVEADTKEEAEELFAQKLESGRIEFGDCEYCNDDDSIEIEEA